MTASALTGILSRAGTLAHGRVVHVEHDRTVRTWVSRLDFVRVSYSPGAPADLPRSLVIKRPPASPVDAARAIDDELDFYRRIAPAVPSPPLVRCLAAVDGSPDGPVLILEDLRASHDHPSWPVPPNGWQSEASIDALGIIHAPWWEHPDLGRGVGVAHTESSLRAMVRGIAEHLPAFFREYGTSLPAPARVTLERVFGSRLRPWLRLTDTRALTLTHGDAHSWNFLFPSAGSGSAYLLDWQMWHIDVGARDLAFMMALHWSPARRHELERDLLRRYHDGIVRRGVSGYSFDDLLLDYRHCIVRNLTFPLIFWSRGMAAERWWYRLEYALAAYRDLECDDLL